MRTAARILFAAALLAPASAHAQELYEQPVGFAELLRLRIDSGVRMERLPLVAEGESLTEPAVFLTIDRKFVYLHGVPLLRLERGMPAQGSLRMCKGRVPCSPTLRRAIAEARSALAVAFNIQPVVVIIVRVDAPYPTLLLAARSAAEAGAALSIRIAARTKSGKVVGVPVLVAPGRTLVFGRKEVPLLAAVEVRGTAIAVHATRDYAEQTGWSHNLVEMQTTLGRLQLRSGRRLCFVIADTPTNAGQAVAVIAAAREVFAHIALTDRGGLRVTRQP